MTKSSADQLEQRVLGEARRCLGATVFSQTGDDWVGHILADDVVLAMPEIGIEVPLAKLYDGLDSPPPMRPRTRVR